MSRESLYLEEIAELKNKLKAGPSKSKGCRYASLLGSFGKLFCISLFLQLLIILVGFCSYPCPSSSLLLCLLLFVPVSCCIEFFVVVLCLE